MRYGIFSDVHSNLEAFRAVIEAYKKENIDQYVFVGDIVGYGANPNECIKLLQEMAPICVCGNHDWGVCDKTPITYFNEYAKKAVLWTKQAIGEEELRFLSDLSLIYRNNDLSAAHGSLDDPAAFNYILDLETAKKSMDVLRTHVGFVGHSHVAFILSEEGDFLRDIKDMDIKLEPDRRYLVNVGSVGQPRDYDPRAAYCVYDTGARQLQIKRVEYDIKTAQDKIFKAGLPRILAYRLSEGT